MFGRKTSSKVQQVAEKYLASLGSSRRQLTDKQWHIIIKHIKSQRLVKPTVLCCLILGVALMGLTVFYWRWAGYEIERVTPYHPIDLRELGDDGTVRVWPQEIKDYLELLASMSFYTGPAFILGVFLLMAVFVVPLLIRKNRKNLEEFIPRENQQVSSPDNPASQS